MLFIYLLFIITTIGLFIFGADEQYLDLDLDSIHPRHSNTELNPPKIQKID